MTIRICLALLRNLTCERRVWLLAEAALGESRSSIRPTRTYHQNLMIIYILRRDVRRVRRSGCTLGVVPDNGPGADCGSPSRGP